MKIDKPSVYWIIYVILLVLVNVILLTFLEDFIVTYLKEPQHFPDFNSILNALYPRLEVEVQRYPTTFFLAKFHQVIIRTNLLAISITIILYSLTFKKFKYYLKKRFYVLSNINENQKKWLNSLLYIACIYYTYDWPKELLALTQVKDFYKPVLFLFWQSDFPSTVVIYIISSIYFITIGICIFNKEKFWPSCITALLFIYQLGILQSFEKIDHTYSSFTYAIILFPLLHLENKYYNRLSLAGIRISIGLCYLFSSLEKLLLGGMNWINGEALKMQLLAEQEAGSWLLETPLPFFASLFVICFQFFFTFSILIGKGYLIFTIAGLLFHWGTAFLINVGGYDTPWVFMYVFLWTMIPKENYKK